MSLCHKLWFSKPSIFGTQYCVPLIFQIYIIWSNRSLSLKCQRSTTLGCEDIGKIRVCDKDSIPFYCFFLRKLNMPYLFPTKNSLQISKVGWSLFKNSNLKVLKRFKFRLFIPTKRWQQLHFLFKIYILS